MDIDAQGAEHGMLRSLMPWLAQLPVQRLHVSTHARWIHRDIRRWLLDAGWVLLADSQAKSGGMTGRSGGFSSEKRGSLMGFRSFDVW